MIGIVILDHQNRMLQGAHLTQAMKNIGLTLNRSMMDQRTLDAVIDSPKVRNPLLITKKLSDYEGDVEYSPERVQKRLQTHSVFQSRELMMALIRNQQIASVQVIYSDLDGVKDFPMHFKYWKWKARRQHVGADGKIKSMRCVRHVFDEKVKKSEMAAPSKEQKLKNIRQALL